MSLDTRFISIRTLSGQLNQIDDLLDTIRKDINNLLDETSNIFFSPPDYPYPLLAERLKKTVETVLDTFKEADTTFHLSKKGIDQDISLQKGDEKIYLIARQIDCLQKKMVFAIELYTQKIAPHTSELISCHKIGLSNHLQGLEPDHAHQEHAHVICLELEEVQEKLELLNRSQ